MKSRISLILAGLFALSGFASAQTKLSALATSDKLWETNARDFSGQFTDLEWEDADKNSPLISTTKNLTLWAESVESVRLTETKNVLSELKFVVLGNESSMLMDKSTFNKRASNWKKLLDKNLGSKGKVVSPISTAKIKHTRVAWKGANYVVILSAKIGTKPDSLEVSFYEPKAGLAVVKLRGRQDTQTRDDDSGTDQSISKIDPNASKEEQKVLSKIAEISARKAAKGISKDAQGALNLLNVYRFLSSVPYNVQLDKKMMAAAEDAVMICKEKGTISHDFGHSTDKCNLAMVSGNFTMKKSVFEYIMDFGANNRDRRGHRRSCLNHKMGKTGFAITGPFAGIFVDDNSAKGVRKNYSYPGHGFYPIKYLHGNGWIYHLASGAAPSTCEVEVWKLNKQEDKLPSFSKEPDGVKLPCTYVQCYVDTIVFEPQAAAITEKGYYLVRLKGRGLKEQYLVKLF